MKKMGVALILTFLILYVVPLGVRPLIIPDETRYVEMAREMLTTGDWVVPKLDGLRYFEKPILGHWLNTAAIFLFGENAFAVRLPSALAVGFSAVLIFFMVRRFSSRDESGLLATMAFLTCFEVFGVGTFCVLDSVFSMLITATLVLSFFALQESVSLSRKYAFLVLAGVSCGLAFLTKGFLAFALPVIVVGPFLLWQRQGKLLLRIWWIPLASAILITLPWCIMIQIKEPDYWRFFLWHEHIQRFLHPDSGQHVRPFWYFIPVILAGALPWSVWLPNAISGLKRIQFKEPFIRFLICWLIFPFLLFSASRGKLETYILPCFPPLIILIIMGIQKWYELPGKERAFTKNQYVSAVLMVLVAAAFVISQIGILGPVKLYLSDETWKWLLIMAALLFYAIMLIGVARRKDTNRRLVYCCWAPLALMFCVPFVIPNQFKDGKIPGEFLQRNSNRIHPDTILVSDNYLTPAVCWFYKRADIYILDRPGEFDYGLNYKGAEKRLIPVEEFPDFITQKLKYGASVALVTRQTRYDEYAERLPKPLFEQSGDGFVLAEFAPEP